MLKYSFLVHHASYNRFTEQLLDLGLVEVQTDQPLSEQSSGLEARIKEGEALLKRLRKTKAPKSELPEPTHQKPLLPAVLQLEKDWANLQHEHESLVAQAEILEPWGPFDWQAVWQLEEAAGLNLRFFKVATRKFEQSWCSQYPLQRIMQKGKYSYFILFEKEPLDFPLVPLAMPQENLEKLQRQIQQLQERLKEAKQQWQAFAQHSQPTLQAEVNQLKDQLQLQRAAANASDQVEGQVRLVQVWCPKPRQGPLEKWAALNHWLFVNRPAEKEEKVPVLLRNNRFSKLFEPIGQMFSLPAYSEMDLTVFFAPFFLLFFGFCLGDAGYGIILLLAGTVARFRLPTAQKPYATLVQLFGLSTTLIGFFSGTLFGLVMQEEPLFAPLKSWMFNQDQMFQIALIIGFVQIIFGMAVQVYKKVVFTGWLSALSQIGWALLLISLGDLLWLEALTALTSISVWVGVALVVLFGAPEKGWLKSIGLGLADLYNLTGMAGDLLSYIRLFALGVSSAILGLVVNEIAFSAQAIPYIGVVLTGLILLIGHSANLMLASLSAFVHPMRLTFVEFYKNTGFLGGGKPFKAFARNHKNHQQTSNS